MDQPDGFEAMEYMNFCLDSMCETYAAFKKVHKERAEGGMGSPNQNMRTSVTTSAHSQLLQQREFAPAVSQVDD